MASVAARAFLKAIRPQASIKSARWFSGFFDQRMSSARLRLSQEWQASMTQRRARQPGDRTPFVGPLAIRVVLSGLSPGGGVGGRGLPVEA